MAVNVNKWIKKTYINIQLLLIRVTRLVKVICTYSDLFLYCLLIVLWILFAIITNWIGVKHDNNGETILRTLWNLRSSMFSSIVLAFIIGAFNRLKDYRKIIKSQHYYYVDSMRDFEEVFSAIVKDEIWWHFHQLYNDRCYELSMEYIRKYVKKINISESGFLKAIDIVRERLDSLDWLIKTGKIIVSDEKRFINYIDSAKRRISDIVMDKDCSMIQSLMFDLYEITEQLRYPWRRDLKQDLELIELSSDAKEDVYKRMWLPDFDIKMLKKEIKVLRQNMGLHYSSR